MTFNVEPIKYLYVSFRQKVGEWMPCGGYLTVGSICRALRSEDWAVQAGNKAVECNKSAGWRSSASSGEQSPHFREITHKWLCLFINSTSLYCLYNRKGQQCLVAVSNYGFVCLSPGFTKERNEQHNFAWRVSGCWDATCTQIYTDINNFYIHENCQLPNFSQTPRRFCRGSGIDISLNATSHSGSCPDCWTKSQLH